MKGVEMGTIKRIIESHVGAGILTDEELSHWAEIFKETLQAIGFTVDDYLATHLMEKEAVWQEFRKRLSECETRKSAGKTTASRSAEEIVLEVNVLTPTGGLMKTFVKRMKWWLVERRTPIEEGDEFIIPTDILLEANTRTWYSRENPLAKVLSISPRDAVWVTADTNVKVNFNPSGPK